MNTSRSKLIQAVNTLSNKDIKSFEKFVSSPYHNSRKELISLWKILKRNKDIDDKHLFNQIFPRQAYNDLKMRHAKSHLLKLLEQYFVIHSLKNRPEYNSLLLDQLRSRGLTSHFNKTIDGIKHNGKDSNAESLYFKYKIRDIQLNNFESKLDCGEAIAFLDEFYWVSKLKLICSQIVFQHNDVKPEVSMDSLPENGCSLYMAYKLCYEYISDEQFLDLTILLKLLSSETIAVEEKENIVFLLLGKGSISRSDHSSLHDVLNAIDFEINERKIDWLIDNCIVSGNTLLARSLIDYSYAIGGNGEKRSCRLIPVHFEDGEYEKCLLLFEELEHREKLFQIDLDMLRIRTLNKLKRYSKLMSAIERFEWRLYREKEGINISQYRVEIELIKSELGNRSKQTNTHVSTGPE